MPENLWPITYTAPQGKLKDAYWADVYVKVEYQCFDSSKPKKPLALELRSRGFRALKEALGQ